MHLWIQLIGHEDAVWTLVSATYLLSIRVSNYAVASTVQERHSFMFCSILHIYMHANFIVFTPKLIKLLVFNAMILFFKFSSYVLCARISFFNLTSKVFLNDKFISLITLCAKFDLILSC